MKILDVADYFRGTKHEIEVPMDSTPYERGDLILVKKEKETLVVRALDCERTFHAPVVVSSKVKYEKDLSEKEISSFGKSQDGESQRVTKAQKLAQKYKLDMRFFAAKKGWKGKTNLFFFVSEEPVDFRALLKDMVSSFSGRIQLERVTARDRARIVDQAHEYTHLGWAPFLKLKKDKVTVSIVRDQGIGTNGNPKIFDVSGKIKTSFLFEVDNYRRNRKYLPHLKQAVEVNGTKGRVTGVDILNHRVKVMLDNDIQDFYDVQDVEFMNKVALPKPKEFDFGGYTIEVEGKGL